MEIFWSIVLFLLGAMMGSFACCQVWRLRKGDKSKRSHCMHCRYQLKWYDNVPILSWLLLRGRCRKCKKPIGVMEILSELGLAVVYLLSFWCWSSRERLMMGDGFEIARFVLFLVLMLSLLCCFLYDLRWQELPCVLLYTNIAIALVFAVVTACQKFVLAGAFSWGLFGEQLVAMCGAFVALPILYYLMYKISHERWVGGGDWILNVALALVLADFWLAMFAMFFANVLGCLAYLPLSLKRKNMNMKIAFGPFLIASFWVIFMAQEWVLGLVAL